MYVFWVQGANLYIDIVCTLHQDISIINQTLGYVKNLLYLRTREIGRQMVNNGGQFGLYKSLLFRYLNIY